MSSQRSASRTEDGESQANLLAVVVRAERLRSAWWFKDQLLTVPILVGSLGVCCMSLLCLAASCVQSSGWDVTLVYSDRMSSM
jgi:hypothetical protein